jgi:hypothetical protein
MGDWQAMQDALATVMNRQTGLSGIWAGQDEVQPARPFWLLNLLSVRRTSPHSEISTSADMTVSDVLVTPVVQDEAEYFVGCNGDGLQIESDADATADEIVAALVEAINESDLPITATDNADGTLSVTHDTPGTLWTLTLTDNLSYINNDDGHEVAQNVGVICSAVISCSVTSSDTLPPDDALSLLSVVHAGLRLPSVLEYLRSDGIAVNDIGPINRFSEVAGGELIDRATFDVFISYAENVTDRTGYIERVEVSGEFENEPDPTEVDFVIE